MEHLRLLLKCVIVVSLSYLIVTYPVKQIPATAKPVQKDHILSLFKKAEATKDVVTDVKKEEPVAAPKPPKIVEEPKVVEVPAPAPEPVVEAPKPAPALIISGTPEAWLKAAGIPVNEWPAWKDLVQKESSWNPLAVNPSSGACSLAQALPCSKIPGDWRDPVNALMWMKSYVAGRYGSVWNALSWWNSHRWY